MNYWATTGTNLSGPPAVRITEGPLRTEINGVCSESYT
jgi:hypothetical protein